MADWLLLLLGVVIGFAVTGGLSVLLVLVFFNKMWKDFF